MKGWVYVISNQSMPGIVKVGYTSKDPELRAAELNHTGSPYPYVVEYEALVNDPYEIEQRTHLRLESVTEGKEWFRCSPEYAIAAIQEELSGGVLLENFKKAQREKAEEIRRKRDYEKRKSEEEAKRKRELEETKKRLAAEARARQDMEEYEREKEEAEARARQDMEEYERKKEKEKKWRIFLYISLSLLCVSFLIESEGLLIISAIMVTIWMWIWIFSTLG